MTRDFTSRTLDKFESFMDSYYSSGENENASGWDRFLYWMGFYKVSTSAGGDYKKYIRSLSKARHIAESEIIRVWRAVGNEEQLYLSKFNGISEQLSSYAAMTRQLQSCIGSGKMGGNYDFDALLTRLKDGYVASLEYKAKTILKKDVSEWTDEDLEILSYVSVYSGDEELVLQIINGFYSEDKTYKEQGMAGVYVRNEEKWDKYIAMSDFYFTERYQDYLYGEPPMSEEEIECSIHNRLIIDRVDNLPDDPLYRRDGEPLQFTKDGKIECWRCNFSPFSNKLPRPQRPNGATLRGSGTLYQWGPDRPSMVTIDTNVKIENGNDAVTAFNMEEGSALTYQLDWIDEGAKKFWKETKKGVKKVGNMIVPGAGTVAGYVIDGVEKIVESQEVPDPAEYEKAFDMEYAGLFEMKVVKTSDGYMAMPTPETRKVVDRVMNWFEQNKEKYPTMYEKYYPKKACYKGYGEPDDPLNFYTSLNMTDFLEDLYGADIDMHELFG